jgi:hypothetical protein
MGPRSSRQQPERGKAVGPEPDFDRPVEDRKRRLVTFQKIGRHGLPESGHTDPQRSVSAGGFPNSQHQAVGLRVVGERLTRLHLGQPLGAIHGRN